MKTEIYTCDIEGCRNKATLLQLKIQVIFHSDQTEGRWTEPYLSDEKIDLCTECHAKILKGNYIHGSGAQGYNTYRFNLDAK